MPEMPDFKALADCHARLDIFTFAVSKQAAVALEQAFRDVWNARGAADRDALLTHGGRLSAKAVALALTALTELDV